MTSPLRSWSRLLTVAALALLVAGAVAPGKGRAECGDYVTVGGKKAPMTSHDSTQPDAPKPCHGPNCSQHPTAPLLPPAPAPTVTFGEWADLLGQLAQTAPTDCRFISDRTVELPVHRSDAIFHPPRFRA